MYYSLVTVATVAGVLDSTGARVIGGRSVLGVLGVSIQYKHDVIYYIRFAPAWDGGRTRDSHGWESGSTWGGRVTCHAHRDTKRATVCVHSVSVT